MALSQPRKIVERDGREFDYGVAAGVTILQSALVILASGFARPGRVGQGADAAAQAADAATYQTVGVAQDTVVGGAANGSTTVRVRRGVFNFRLAAGGDAPVAADIGKPVFVVDDDTVGRTNPNNTRVRAGTLVSVDAEGAWVRVGPGL